MGKLIHGGDIYTAMDQGKEVLDFSANINPLGIPNSIKEAVIHSIDMCVNYPDPLCRKLGKELASKLNTSEEYLTFGNGAADLIFRLVLTEKPKKALLLAPTFAEYEQALKTVECDVEHYQLSADNSFGLDDDFLNHINEGLDIIFLCNPNNPTGQLIEQSLLIKIVEKCQSLNIRLMLDECFIDFVKEPDNHTMINFIKEKDTLFLLRSFTKSYAIPGLRLGYGICSDKELLTKISEQGQPWSVSLLAQEAGRQALSEDAYLQDSRNIIFEERSFLVNELSALGYQTFVPESNYIFFSIIENANKLDDELKEDYIDSFQNDMEKENILIRCCANYIGLKKGYFRIAVRNHKENTILVDTLKRREEEWQKR